MLKTFRHLVETNIYRTLKKCSISTRKISCSTLFLFSNH